MREEHDLDRARIDAHAIHVRKQRRTPIQQETTVHHHGPVVAIRRKRRTGTEERELQAMVTAGFRYTS
jgi:hypothetical protein